MNQSRRNLFKRIVSLAKPYWFANDKETLALPRPISWLIPSVTLPTKWVGRGLLLLLLAGLVAVNILNVKLNFAWGEILNQVQEWAMATGAGNADAAQAAKDSFYTNIYAVGMVFLYGTFIVVFYRWIRMALALSWRKWMTNHFMKRYFESRNYYRVGNNPDIDNPDERMHQDIDAVVSQTLSIGLVLLDSVITLASFATVLWAISQTLTWIVIGYSLVGSVLILLFGRKLVFLNFMQLKLEADYRFSLIHVRNHTESIAFYGGEERELETVKGRFGQVTSNYWKLIGWTRNVGFFQTAFDYFVTIIPYLVIAPLVFAGTAKIGAFQQASMAFSMILGSLAVFVSQFQSLAQFAANVNRLGTFSEALNAPPPVATPEQPRINTVIEPRVATIDLTLMTPNYSRTLIEHLTTEVPVGEGMLVRGPSGSGKSSLLRGFSGLWDSGRGTMVHPDLGSMMFLPQEPYMLLGTLRDQLLFPDATATDEELLALLKLVNLPDLAQQMGGLDSVHNWDMKLSPGMRQRIAFARLLLHRPKIAFLDEATSALDEANEDYLYGLLKQTGTTFISVGHRPSLKKYHTTVLELDGNGGAVVRPITDRD